MDRYFRSSVCCIESFERSLFINYYYKYTFLLMHKYYTTCEYMHTVTPFIQMLYLQSVILLEASSFSNRSLISCDQPTISVQSCLLP